MYRSSRPELYYLKSALKNFAKIIGKHLRRRLFVKKVSGTGVFF